jgi:hypothetical protein
VLFVSSLVSAHAARFHPGCRVTMDLKFQGQFGRSCAWGVRAYMRTGIPLRNPPKQAMV